MSGSAVRAAAADDAREERPGGQGWLEWLRDRLDPAWRAGEWDGLALLFTGDLESPRTAAWPCRTPACPTGTRRPSGRCDGCRRARAGAGLSWAQFDAGPLQRATRPLQRGSCAVPGCEGDLHCAGLCYRHERAWGKHRTEPVAAFIARARPLARASECRVAGCDRESIARRGLCRFHDQRLHREGLLAGDDLAAWIAGQQPRLGVHQFSLAGLPELLRTELLYALQQRDHSPPPLDPTEVRILLGRLGGAGSLREADPHAVCESGGTVYNTATRGLFRSPRRHLDRARAQYCGIDPFAGGVWQVALLDLQINASRRWPATQGVIDFGVVSVAWLREIVKDWARTTRPYVQRLRETLRACQAASYALTAAGRTEQAALGAGDFTQIIDAISAQRRAGGSLYSASHRNLMIYQFCQVIEYGRASGLMTAVPDPFRPPARHRVHDDPNEDELGKALPETVIRQLDTHLQLLGPAGRAGAIRSGAACSADRRGHGRSAQTGDGHDMDHYADDLAAVTAHLDLRGAVHVGHSTGGGEVVRYIARHVQSRVAKAVLISSVPPLMVQTGANPGGLPKSVFDDLQAQLAANRSEFYRALPSGPFYGFNRPGARSSEAIIGNWWRQGMMGGAKAHYDGIVAFSQTDFTEDLKKISVPVLVMHGDDDQIVPYADSGPLSARLVQNGTLKTYEGFPHGMPTTQAETINADLLAFIQS